MIVDHDPETRYPGMTAVNGEIDAAAVRSLSATSAARDLSAMIQNPPPWPNGARCAVAITFDMDADSLLHIDHPTNSLTKISALPEGPGRADLFRHAKTLGGLLFQMLFDEADAEKLATMIGADRPRPVLQIRSDDPLLRSLPWELLWREDRFLLREGDVDLLRSTTDEVDGATLLKEPREPFKLVVNVLAPDNSGLDYEGESYRISLATAGRCAMAPTELGTLDDLIETVEREKPRGIHFSGHAAVRGRRGARSPGAGP